MEQTKTQRQRRSPGAAVLKILFVLFVLCLLVLTVSIRVGITEQEQKLAAVRERIEALEESNEEYQRLLSVEDDKEYMEQIAVEQLGYAYPNEQRFYVRN